MPALRRGLAAVALMVALVAPAAPAAAGLPCIEVNGKTVVCGS